MGIRQLAPTESVQATTAIDPDKRTVTCTYSVRARQGEGNPRYAITSTFDFSKVSTAALLELALYQVKMWVQVDWRHLMTSSLKSDQEAALTEDRWSEIDVAELYQRKKDKAPDLLSATQRNINQLLDRLPPEEVQQQIQAWITQAQTEREPAPRPEKKPGRRRAAA